MYTYVYIRVYVYAYSYTRMCCSHAWLHLEKFYCNPLVFAFRWWTAIVRAQIFLIHSFLTK